jgi:hypothetical protein
MHEHWLTVKLVEGIHNAVLSGRSVTTTVGNLEGATLPALLEYRCLQWAFKFSTVPPLPQAIVSSPLGVALARVKSDLGLRTTGPQ